MAFALLAYLCRNMYRRYLYKIADTETGVFTIGERATKIAKLANLKTRKYRPPRLLWNGDHLTIASALLEPYLPRIDFEQRIHNGTVAVDFAHPSNASRGRIAFLLPGVGGDSNSTYVRASASSLLQIGYSVVVIHSRGLGDHTPHLENPLSSVDVNTLVDDIRDVIQSYFPDKKFYEGGSSQHYTHGVVVGFSLGMFSCVSGILLFTSNSNSKLRWSFNLEVFWERRKESTPRNMRRCVCFRGIRYAICELVSIC